MPWMRNLRTPSNARESCERQPSRFADLLERERIEHWRDLALEPGIIALGRMLAHPGGCEVPHPRECSARWGLARP